MAQFAWESERDGAALVETNETDLKTNVEPETVALDADDFAALEERIVRVMSLVQRERQARKGAEDRVGELEMQLKQQAPQAERLNDEIKLLRSERDEVRQRIEYLLKQLDALEL